MCIWGYVRRWVDGTMTYKKRSNSAETFSDHVDQQCKKLIRFRAMTDFLAKRYDRKT